MNLRFVCLPLALLAGCDSSSSSTNDLAAPPDLAVAATPDLAMAPPDLAMVAYDLGGPKVNLTGVVTDQSSQMPIMGVSVCLNGTTACAMTDASGKFTLPVPASSQILISYKATNYLDAYAEYTTGAMDLPVGYILVKAATASLLAQLFGATFDDTKGILTYAAVDAQQKFLSGVTYTATPVAGSGPFYFNMMGLPDKTAMSTGPNGVGLNINAPVGSYEVKAALQGKTCGLAFGWAGMSAGSIKIVSIAGSITTINFVCM